MSERFPCDEILDVCAAVDALRVDDVETLTFILKVMDRGTGLVIALKMLAAAAEQSDISPQTMRKWALSLDDGGLQIF